MRSRSGNECGHSALRSQQCNKLQMDSGAAQAILMYFVLPVWLAAGFADYLCHRASSIETTSGWKESLLHLLQFGEMAIPTLAAIFLQINALVIATMIICLIAHEATAIWDVSYAYEKREVTPTEQHVHSFLEMLPLMGLLIVATLHWQQFLSLNLRCDSKIRHCRGST